jgi:hypothetical protein
VTLGVLLLQITLLQPLPQAPAHALLDVPFVAQTPELCGGAAVSMVLRYWGQRDVFPQDFAPLVTRGDGGILTGTLASAVRERGWKALVDPPPADRARERFSAELDRGRPIIALIQVAPRVYHYVVIVGVTANEVVFHDPARAPFRVLDWTAFDRDWSAANRWMMVALPPDGFVPAKDAAVAPAAPAGSSSAPTSASTPCSALVAHAVEAALAGQSAEAELELGAARRLCPNDPAAWRETAGLRFTQKRWADANDLATTAARLAPADRYSWELAATSRYLMGDRRAALAAWNRIGEPRVDAVTVHGAERTHVPVVVHAAGLEPRSLLTPNAFTRALRRVRDVPAISAADIKFDAQQGGAAAVDIAVVERPAWPGNRSGLFLLAARPALQREVRVDVSGLSGAGESAFAAWRFARRRPKVSLGLAFPSPRWLTGVTAFSAMWERQNYDTALGGGAPLFKETRRRAGLQLSDWASGWINWQVGGALDRFNDAGYVSADASVLARAPGDRFALRASAGTWQPTSDGRRFATGGLRASMRSTPDVRRPMLSAVVEYQRVGEAAPLAVWPSAGTGTGTERASVLRGHQLVEDGIVKGDVLGRQLVNASIEYSQPVGSTRGASFSVATFVDAARATLPRAGFTAPPTYVDAGVGLRIRLPGSLGGVRIDVGHRLGNGRTIFSAGWLPVWPR